LDLSQLAFREACVSSKLKETPVDTQVRLVLEQQCAETFRKLYTGRLRRWPFTLIAADFGEAHEGNVAFKTSLTKPDLADAFTRLLEGWVGGAPRFAPEGVDAVLLRQVANGAKDSLPAGVGFIILIGDALESAYVSSCERTDVAKMLRNDLLPEWTANV
jgi:hypothetical protein